MKTFLGFFGALLVGLCVGMTSMTFCPYLSKFVCQARCQAGQDCCVVKKCNCKQPCSCCEACPGKTVDKCCPPQK